MKYPKVGEKWVESRYKNLVYTVVNVNPLNSEILVESKYGKLLYRLDWWKHDGWEPYNFWGSLWWNLKKLVRL